MKTNCISNFLILQDPIDYTLLSIPVLNTIAALCYIAGIKISHRQVQMIATSTPVSLTQINSTVSRIITAYKWAVLSQKTQSLCASLLEARVKEIDRHSQWIHGFLHEAIVSEESKQLLPAPINFSAPLEEWCYPIQNFAWSRNSLQCQLIGSVLYILLINRIYIGHPKLATTEIDWSDMIYRTIFPEYAHGLPAYINNSVLSCVKEITAPVNHKQLPAGLRSGEIEDCDPDIRKQVNDEIEHAFSRR